MQTGAHTYAAHVIKNNVKAVDDNKPHKVNTWHENLCLAFKKLP